MTAISAPVAALDPATATVGDVMHPGVVAAHENAAFKQIVDALVRNGISAVPVIDDNRRVVGVVSESDLLARLSDGRPAPRAATARELMTAPPVVTQRGTPVADAAHLATQAGVRRLPVVDSDGVLVGIVTRADLLKGLLRPDEETTEDGG